MPASYVTEDSTDFSTPLQYVEEATVGTTPSASPTFLEIGKINSFNVTHDTDNKKFRVLGSEDLLTAVKTGEAYAIQVEYSMFNTTFFKYLSQARGGGAGSIDKTFSLLWGHKVNGTASFEIASMCRINSGSITVTPDDVRCSLSIIAGGVTVPNAVHGLTTPTLITQSTSDPWVGLDGGANPLTHNSLNYDVPSFTINISRNLHLIRVNGQVRIIDNPATKRDVTGTFSVVRKDEVLKADAKALTKRVMSYVLDSGVATISLTNVQLEQITEDYSAEASEHLIDNYGYFAKTVSLN